MDQVSKCERVEVHDGNTHKVMRDISKRGISKENHDARDDAKPTPWTRENRIETRRKTEHG